MAFLSKNHDKELQKAATQLAKEITKVLASESALTKAQKAQVQKDTAVHEQVKSALFNGEIAKMYGILQPPAPHGAQKVTYVKTPSSFSLSHSGHLYPLSGAWYF